MSGYYIRGPHTGGPLVSKIETNSPGRTRARIGHVAAPASLLAVIHPLLSNVDSPASKLSALSLLGAAVLLLGASLVAIERVMGPALVALLLFLCYLVNSGRGADHAQGYQHTVAVATAVAFFIGASALGETWIQRSSYRVSTYIFSALSIVAVVASSTPKNAAGGIIFYLIALVVVVRRAGRGHARFVDALAVAGAGAVVSVLLDFRSLLFYSAVFLLAFLGWRLLKPAAYVVAGVVGAGLVVGGTIWFFVNIYTSPIAMRISTRVQQVTGHRANSGRDYLWPRIMREVDDNRLFGQGSGTLPKDFLGVDLSSHNYYLQTYLQVGIVGIALVVLFLLVVWIRMATSGNSVSGLGSALLVTFVVHNGTEVLMFQNNLEIASVAWLGIGLACSLSQLPDLQAQEAPVANGRTGATRLSSSAPGGRRTVPETSRRANDPRTGA